MPEIAEVNVFRFWIQRFIDYARDNLPPGDLQIQALFTDIKDSDLEEMASREQRVLAYSSTFKVQMLKDAYHVVWATRLRRLAEAVPDSHGLLIPKVWKRLPESIRSQISPNHCCWDEFSAAIKSIQEDIVRVPKTLPLPWYRRPTAGKLEYDLPSNTQLVVKLNCYMPPTWRGTQPDPRVHKPPAQDKVWEDPITLPPTIKTVFPSPKTLHHSVHGDVFGPIAPVSLSVPFGLSNKQSRGTMSTAKSTASAQPKKTRKQQKPKDKVSTTNALLTSYRFTTSKMAGSSTPSVAGVSAHLASLGVNRTVKKPEQRTEHDIDHSLYLFPAYLFPSLANGSAITDCGLELKGLEHDPRSLILDLGSCYMEIELLLHTSPQIFVNEDWDHITRVPADSRGFKVVLALQMKSYTIAFLSNDSLCYIYWYSRADIDLARAARVPDVLFEYWTWCKYVVHWLAEQDINPRWDNRPLAYVLSMAGSHPMRGVGRYSSDEIAWMSGVPLHTLWGDVRRDPRKLCAILESFFLFTLERFVAMSEILTQCLALNKLCGKDTSDTDTSFLLISTKATVLRYDRMLSVHKKLSCSMSERKKRLVLQYNHLSLISHKQDPEAMRYAPWPFDLADLAPALLLPGHMGPMIVPNWQDLLRVEGISATTEEMRDVYRTKLPPGLTMLDRLAFKPVVDLTPVELQMLSLARGGDTNPVVQYFEHKQKLFPTQYMQTPTPPPPPSYFAQARACSSATGNAVLNVALSDVVLADPLDVVSSDMELAVPVEDVVMEELHPNLPDVEDARLEDAFVSKVDQVEDMKDGDSFLDTLEDDDIFLGALPLLTDSESEGEADHGSRVPGGGQLQQFIDPCCEDEEQYQRAGLWTPDVQGRLTLIQDSSVGKRLPTRLYRSTVNPPFYTWTPLKLPRITTEPNILYQPPGSVVFNQCVNSVRTKKTLRSIKTTSKLYAVGPLDFCGHAKAVKRGKGWVISLCRWDPTLDDKDQLFMASNWEALGSWPEGFRKAKRSLVKKAVAFRAAAKTHLVKTWTEHRDITEHDIDVEVSRQKKVRREAAHQKALQKASEAAAKAAKKQSTRLKGKGRRKR